MTCHYVIDKGEKVFIPGCWGGVIDGKEGCYCRHKSQKDKLMELEKRVKKLEQLIKSHP